MSGQAKLKQGAVRQGYNIDPNQYLDDLFALNSESYKRGISSYNSDFRMAAEMLEHQAVIDKFKLRRKVLALDLETTGLSQTDELFQFGGIVLDENFNPLASKEELIKTAVPFSPEARTKLDPVGLTESYLEEHGIERSKGKENILKFLEETHAKHGKVSLMGQNVRFDAEKLKALIGEQAFDTYFDTEVYDLMGLANFAKKAKDLDLKSTTLGRIAAFFGENQEAAHTATDDIKNSVRYYARFLEMLSGGTIDVAAVNAINFSRITPSIKTSAVSRASSMFKTSIDSVPTSVKALSAFLAGAAIYSIAAEGSDEEPEPLPVRKPILRFQNPDIMNAEHSSYRIRDQRSHFPFVQKEYNIYSPVGSRKERGGTYV